MLAFGISHGGLARFLSQFHEAGKGFQKIFLDV